MKKACPEYVDQLSQKCHANVGLGAIGGFDMDSTFMGRMLTRRKILREESQELTLAIESINRDPDILNKMEDLNRLNRLRAHIGGEIR